MLLANDIALGRRFYCINFTISAKSTGIMNDYSMLFTKILDWNCGHGQTSEEVREMARVRFILHNSVFTIFPSLV
jgi:hypothetical protein